MSENVVNLVPSKLEPSPETRHAIEVPHRTHANPKSPFRFVGWLIVVALGVAGWYYHEKWLPVVLPLIGLEQKAPPKPRSLVVPVVAVPVQKKDMDIYINGLGTVTAFKTVTIRSRVEGELVKVAFTEGQMVKENDMLAEIDTRPFDVQLQQAEGQLTRDEATLNSAEFTLKRYQELLGKNSIAPQQVDEQKALVQQMQGAIRSDKAMVSNAKLQLDYCHITAPISGRIGLRLVDQGNIVRANDLTGMAVITQLQPIALVFTIPQDDISRVQKATLDGKELKVEAFDRSFKTKLAVGKLLAIDNQVDATTGTVRLKAEFKNDDGLLFPNQFVNARLLVDQMKDAIVIPAAAVQRGPTSTFVYVVQQNDDEATVDLRNVKTGIVEGSETAILSGLEPGELVVTDGLDKLRKDAKVTLNTGEKKDKDNGKVKEAEKEAKKNPVDSGTKGVPGTSEGPGKKDSQ